MTQPQEFSSPSAPRPVGARNAGGPRTSDRSEHTSRSRKRGLLRTFWEILEGMSA
jgi:hypothetical protein